MNAAIHVLMYLYYGLASCGPKIQKYLWWKKYLTIIQMVRHYLTVWLISTELYSFNTFCKITSLLTLNL